MDEHFLCEDCGHEFPETGLERDIEDDLEGIACPQCGGLDIQLVAAGEGDTARDVA